MLARKQLVGGLLASLLLTTMSVAHADIVWRVANGFPLLDDAQYDAVRNEWSSDRLSSDRSMWSFIRMRMEDKKSGALGEGAFLLAEPRRKIQDVVNAMRAEAAVVRLTAPGQNCQWQIEPKIATADMPERGQCQTSMRVSVNTPYMVSVHSSAGRQTAITVRVRPITVVAMGDSYGSGEGSPDRPAMYPDVPTPKQNEWFMRRVPGTQVPVIPAVWWDPVCHRSLLSWPVLTTLRLALESDDAVVYLINVACSGAEFIDGFFLAQERTSTSSDPIKDGLTNARDGLGRRGVPPNSVVRWFLPRSQANAVRDALCPEPRERSQIDVPLPNAPFQAQMQDCGRAMRRPDALLLSGGGNDVQFAAVVRGILLPIEARSAIGGPLLALFRKLSDSIGPSDLTARALELTPDYPGYVDAVQLAAGVDHSRTVLLGYPNPVGTNPASCSHPKTVVRVRNSFMTFGPAIDEYAPWFVSPFIDKWTVVLSKREATTFIDSTYPAIVKMQTAAGTRYVPWLPLSETSGMPLASRSHSDRLLCEDSSEVDRQLALEPFYFCQKTAASPDECSNVAIQVGAAMPKGSISRKPNLKDWRSEVPGRRLVNTTNDALLAQRSWVVKPSSGKELLHAIAGTMHPTPEANAVGADSAYTRLQQVVHSRKESAVAHPKVRRVATRRLRGAAGGL